MGKLYHFTNSAEIIIKEGFKCPVSSKLMTEYKGHFSFIASLSKLVGRKVEFDSVFENETLRGEILSLAAEKFSGYTMIWSTSDKEYDHDLCDGCLKVSLPADSITVFDNGVEFAHFVKGSSIPSRFFKIVEV